MRLRSGWIGRLANVRVYMYAYVYIYICIFLRWRAFRRRAFLYTTGRLPIYGNDIIVIIIIIIDSLRYVYDVSQERVGNRVYADVTGSSSRINNARAYVPITEGPNNYCAIDRYAVSSSTSTSDEEFHGDTSRITVSFLSRTTFFRIRRECRTPIATIL